MCLGFATYQRSPSKYTEINLLSISLYGKEFAMSMLLNDSIIM